jgi:hypothetical protein
MRRRRRKNIKKKKERQKKKKGKIQITHIQISHNAVTYKFSLYTVKSIKSSKNICLYGYSF